MKRVTTTEQDLYKTAHRAAKLRVLVRDGDGVWRDLATYAAAWGNYDVPDLVKSASWGEDVDSPGMTADIELQREVDRISLAPFVEDSPLNRGWNIQNMYAPLLDVGRELKIETVIVDADGTEVAGVNHVGDGGWKLQFHGYIDRVDWGGEGGVRIECRDLMARLMDTIIEYERAYSYAATGGAVTEKKGLDIFEPLRKHRGVGSYVCPTEAKSGGPDPGAWAASTNYALKDRRRPTADNGFYYEVKVDNGSSGSSEPSWPTTLGATVTDGGITWECKGKIGRYYKLTAFFAGQNFHGAVEPGDPNGGVNTSPWPSSGTLTHLNIQYTVEGTVSMSKVQPVQEVMQSILNDNAGKYLAGLDLIIPETTPQAYDVQLVTPVDPLWTIKMFVQKRESVYEALKALATQIGWDVRYKWDWQTESFKLNLWSPDREKATPDFEFPAGDYYAIDQLAIDITMIRTAGAVTYSDSADLDPGGRPKRKRVEYVNNDGVKKFGRRFFEIPEEPTSNIDTGVEADTFLQRIIKDLAQPKAEMGVRMDYFPLVELGDLYRFPPNERTHTMSNLDLAVVSYRHEFSDGKSRTSMTCRGKPIGGYKKWHETYWHAPHAKQTMSQTDLVVSMPSANDPPVIGGIRLKLASSEAKSNLAELFDVHVSETSGAAPTEANRKMRTRGKDIVLSDLMPGKTYYGRVVPVAENSDRTIYGLPTEEFSFVAGRGDPGHLRAEYDYGKQPLNGDFESPVDLSKPPDHWEVVTGTYGTDLKRLTGLGEVRSFGRTALRFEQTAMQTQVNSNIFYSRPYPAVYLLEVWTQALGTPTAGKFCEVLIDFYDSEGSIGNTITYQIEHNAMGAKRLLVKDDITAWGYQMRARIRKSDATAFGFVVDEVRLSLISADEIKSHKVLSTAEDSLNPVNAHIFDTFVALTDPDSNLQSWRNGGTTKLEMSIAGSLTPGTDLGPDLGAATKRFLQMVAKKHFAIGAGGTDPPRLELWKDTTPTQAASIGMGKPGVAPVDDLTFSVYNGIEGWREKFRLRNASTGVMLSTTEGTFTIKQTGGTWQSQIHVLNEGGAGHGLQVESLNLDLAEVGFKLSGGDIAMHRVESRSGSTFAHVTSGDPEHQFLFTTGEIPFVVGKAKVLSRSDHSAPNLGPGIINFGALFSPAVAGTTYLRFPTTYQTSDASEVKFRVPSPGRISKMYIQAFGNTNSGGTTTITVRKNGVDTALTATLAASGTQAADTTNSFTVVAGDQLSCKIVLNAGANGQLTEVHATMRLVEAV